MRSFVIGVLFLSFVLAGLSVPEASAQQKVITLNYSNYHAALNPNSKICEDWSREVEKRTNGRIKISYLSRRDLTPPTQTYDSVVRGIADIGFSMASLHKGKFPLPRLLTYPLVTNTGYRAGMMVNA